MFKAVKITLDNFNNSKSSSAVVLLSRLEKAINEKDDFPFYVKFDVLGGISQMRSMIMRFVPKPEADDKMKDCEEDDEMIKYVTAETHEKDLDDVYDELDALKDKVGDIEAQQGLDFQKQIIKGLRCNNVHDLDAMADTIDLLMKKNTDCVYDIECLDKARITHDKELDDLKGAINRLEKQVKILKNNVNEQIVFNNNCVYRFENIDNIIDEHDKVLDDLRGAINRIEKQQENAVSSANDMLLDSLHSMLVDLIKRVDSLESAYKNNCHDIEAVDRTVCRLKDRLEPLSNLIKRVDSMESHDTEQIDRISYLEHRVNDIRHDVDELEQSVAINTHNVDDNCDAINKLAAKTDERFEKCYTDKHSINDLYDNIKRLDDILYALNVRVSGLERKILK